MCLMQEEHELLRVQLPSPYGKQNPAPRWEPLPWSQTSLASRPHCPSWRFGHEVWEPSFVLLSRRGVAMGTSASLVGGIPLSRSLPAPPPQGPQTVFSGCAPTPSLPVNSNPGDFLLSISYITGPMMSLDDRFRLQSHHCPVNEKRGIQVVSTGSGADAWTQTLASLLVTVLPQAGYLTRSSWSVKGFLRKRLELCLAHGEF